MMFTLSVKRFCTDFFLFLSLLCFFSCSSKKEITVLDWNLQAFFDGVRDGNEYQEFLSSNSSWNSESYKKRLSNLCEVIKELNPDIIVFEELENSGQLYDITNIVNTGFNISSYYRWALFSKGKSSIGCGIISRFPLSDSYILDININKDSFTNPVLRPLIFTNVTVNNKCFALAALHWKSSMSKVSVKARLYQEALLSDGISFLPAAEQGIFICGDFNRDIRDFDFEDGCILLKGKDIVSVRSPLIDDSGIKYSHGSYWYKEKWSYIDNFFVYGNIEISDFEIKNSGKWADEQGHPLPYKVWSGYGWSDHLPVLVRLSI